MIKIHWIAVAFFAAFAPPSTAWAQVPAQLTATTNPCEQVRRRLLREFVAAIARSYDGQARTAAHLVDFELLSQRLRAGERAGQLASRAARGVRDFDRRARASEGDALRVLADVDALTRASVRVGRYTLRNSTALAALPVSRGRSARLDVAVQLCDGDTRIRDRVEGEDLDGLGVLACGRMNLATRHYELVYRVIHGGEILDRIAARRATAWPACQGVPAPRSAEIELPPIAVTGSAAAQ